MQDNYSASSSKKTKDDDELLFELRKMIQQAEAMYSPTREVERHDLQFYFGSSENNYQWPEIAVNARKNDSSVVQRPMLTINTMPQHAKLITNDFRQNLPAVKTIPANDKGDVEVCEVYDDYIRHIEYVSQADSAYINAVFLGTVIGEGYVQIATEYSDPMSFHQDIKILRVRDSFSVKLDPFCSCPFGSDAEWGSIEEDIGFDEFKEMYPDAIAASNLDQYSGDGYWVNDKRIKVMCIYKKQHTKKKLHLYYNGLTAIQGSKEDKEAQAKGMVPVKSRDTQVTKVMWYKTNGFEILDRGEWAGSYIPFVRLVNNESFINGQIGYSGIVRNAKDAQRMYNYWVSQEAEMLALAPKAPFVCYAGQIDGYEGQWKTANVKNHAVLQANATIDELPGVLLPLPQRAAPPLVQAGLVQAKMGAIDDIKRTTGQYDASLGATSNEKSGKAILARERQSDTGTFDYLDQANKMIQWVGRQLVDLIPKVVDIETVKVVLGEDKNAKNVALDPLQEQAVRQRTKPNGSVEKIYNLNVGKYDVMVTTGPNYMTKRQESLDNMAQLLQGNPDLWKVAGDLFIKNMDWPGAQEISERFAQYVNPEMQEGGEDPRMQAMQQQIMQMQQMLESVQNSFEAKDLEIKMFDAETKRMSAMADAEAKAVQADVNLIKMDQDFLKSLDSNQRQRDNQGNT